MEIYLISLIFSFLVTLTLTPILRELAMKFQLVDKPNHRKVHSDAVPLIGGLTVFIATIIVIIPFYSTFGEDGIIKVIALGTLALLLMGVVDDKVNLRASIKLLIQLLLAHYVVVNGIAVTSFHGVFGIYELPTSIQYILTVLIITGSVNAFNLMDGIDGLAAGLAIVALILFSYLAYVLGQGFLLLLYIVLIGSLIGFLRFNLSKNSKIFMGDAGSLFLGFILVVSGMKLINVAEVSSENLPLTLALVIGVLILPVIDSLRVYRSRIKNGYSPFKADKTHLHHLVLLLGIKHKYSSLLIVGISLIIIALNVYFGSHFGITYSLATILLFFIMISGVLKINQDVKHWREEIRKMEETPGDVHF